MSYEVWRAEEIRNSYLSFKAEEFSGQTGVSIRLLDLNTACDEWPSIWHTTRAFAA